MRRSSPVAIAIFAGAIAVSACTPAASTGTATVTPTSSPAESGEPVASAPIAPSSSAGATAVVDPALLDVLPADLSGLALIRDADTAREIVAGGGLPDDVEALAVGLYASPGSSAGGDDLAIVNVVRLRPGSFDDAWFRSWRETFDVGACDRAGGVAPGTAEAEIDGRPVHIGTCQGGVHTYHVHLSDPDRLISITALGDARFGERVLAGLTE